MSRTHTDLPRYGGPRLTDAVRAGWNATRQAFGSGFHAFQRAQMMRALNGLSDGQLAHIGLKRSDIARHAERLVAREGKGRAMGSKG